MVTQDPSTPISLGAWLWVGHGVRVFPQESRAFPLPPFITNIYIFLDREKEKTLKRRDLRKGKRSQLGKGNGDVLRGEELGREGQSGCEERQGGGCGWGGCECKGWPSPAASAFLSGCGLVLWEQLEGHYLGLAKVAAHILHANCEPSH